MKLGRLKKSRQHANEYAARSIDLTMRSTATRTDTSSSMMQTVGNRARSSVGGFVRTVEYANVQRHGK